MPNDLYEEDFVKDHVLNDPDSIQYVLNSIYEIHSPEHGWTCSNPIITPNEDGKTVTIRIHLTHQRVLDDAQNRSR